MTNSERILARQSHAECHEQLLRELEEEGVDIVQAMSYADAMDELSEDEDDGDDNDDKDNNNDKIDKDGNGNEKRGSWTMKQRLKDHREDIRRKSAEEEKKKKQMDDLLNTNSSYKSVRYACNVLAPIATELHYNYWEHLTGSHSLLPFCVRFHHSIPYIVTSTDWL